eukprot:TRINITY_DN6377_c0_g2_i2.p1 TRINITY_DN6377_c0_g2~~TRINITY_DN6377_c0_g2_i2.p1  ORF type:complete len:558 (+),score=74.85 TRINITY_DN6377_c0_g2_i2:98-1675(+)
MSQTYTLASRVCQKSPLLITSDHQNYLIQAINSYLGLSNNASEGNDFLQADSSMSFGALLFMLCVTAWFLSICKNLRSQWSRVVALHSIPRSSRSKVVAGAYEQISYGRAMAMLICSTAQVTFAAFLFYLGTLWLAYTTTFSDLILNYAALAAILDIDSIIFESAFPRKLQFAIQGLEAIKVQRTHRDNLCETLVLLILTFTIVVAVFFGFLRSDDGIIHSMMSVKKEMCEGNLDFVVRYNPNTQQVFWMDTRQAQFRGADALREAVHELKGVSGMAGSAQFAHEIFEYKDLERRGEEKPTDLFNIRSECDDYLVARERAASLNDTALVHSLDIDWATLKILTGKSKARTCRDMTSLCDDPELPLLRIMCPVTCQCSAFLERGYLRAPDNGCSLECLKQNITFNTRCRDDQVAKADWDLFWDQWLSYNLTAAGHQDREAVKQAKDVKEKGCQALTKGTDLHYLCYQQTSRPWRGLAAMCPQECMCEGPRLDSSIATMPHEECPGGCGSEMDCITSNCFDAAWLPA